MAAAAATRVTATAVLGQRGSGAREHRSQNAGHQNKAPALGTHDSHLPLPIALLRNDLNLTYMH